MRILFWVPYPTEGASNRYRVEQYFTFLKKEGIEYTIHAFWAKPAFEVLYKEEYFLKKIYFFVFGTLCRFLDILQIYKYDIVFIHRESYPIFGAFFESILAMLKKPVIFDFDDSIFLTSTSQSNNFIEKFKTPQKVIDIIKSSEHIIAGNAYLANFALKYNPFVSVIPTCIDMEKYHQDLKKPKETVTIGWVGSITTIDFLKPIKNIFIQLSRKYKNINFKIVGGELSFPELSNIISKPWALSEEADDLKSFDIGIMPMPDNEWTKGKCGFKAILYMSAGIPCVCSMVGVNTEIIKDGINGFLANNEEEWIDKLSLLIENPGLRQQIGLSGRKTVEERYSLKVNTPKFLEIINEVYNRNRRE